MIPIFCTGGQNIPASFSDVVSVLETEIYVNKVELVTVVDVFTPNDPVLSFFDIIEVNMTYAISGADGLTGSPAEIGTVADVFTATLDGDITLPETQTASDTFVAFLT